MANWKKVIVSGSNAELNTVTASFFSGDGSALTNVPAGSLNIESFTDGTAITVATTDKLILSDAGTEKFIQVSQLPFTTANVSTDLSTTLSTTAVRINSSDGTNATIGAATTSAAGIMTKAIFDEHETNKKKVTNVSTDLSITGTTGARTIVSSDGTNAVIPVGTSASGTNVAGVITPSMVDAITANTAKSTNVSTNLSEGTSTTTSVDVNSSDGTNATLAAASTTRAGVLTTAKFDEIVANTAKSTNVSTDLSATLSTTAIKINSSDGADVSIGAATTSAAGIMTKAIFDEHTDNNKKVSNVTTNLSITGTTGARTIVSSDGTNAIIPVATTLVSGVMSKAIFDEHVLNNAKVTNSHNNDVSVANLKTRLAGGFGSNAVQIGDSDDVVTIGNKLVVTGDLQVSGTTTTVDTNNLNVKDQFINLNDGGSAADGGLVVEGAGAAFGWDNDKGRWAFDLAGATEGQTSITSDAYAVSVHNGNVGAQLTGYAKVGNMYVDKNEDIFIYTV
jgi:hypothetical protein